jgi:hypothetical protein
MVKDHLDRDLRRTKTKHSVDAVVIVAAVVELESRDGHSEASM